MKRVELGYEPTRTQIKSLLNTHRQDLEISWITSKHEFWAVLTVGIARYHDRTWQILPRRTVLTRTGRRAHEKHRGTDNMLSIIDTDIYNILCYDPTAPQKL